jgi:hypothetical protein
MQDKARATAGSSEQPADPNFQDTGASRADRDGGASACLVTECMHRVMAADLAPEWRAMPCLRAGVDQ